MSTVGIIGNRGAVEVIKTRDTHILPTTFPRQFAQLSLLTTEARPAGTDNTKALVLAIEITDTEIGIVVGIFVVVLFCREWIQILLVFCFFGPLVAASWRRAREGRASGGGGGGRDGGSRSELVAVVVDGVEI
ncbi:hypothetical protein WAI453_009900 [Rhynchosporium graminicola]